MTDATAGLPAIPDPLILTLEAASAFDANGNEWLDYDLDEEDSPAAALLDEPTCAVCGAFNVRLGFACVSDASPTQYVRVVCASHVAEVRSDG